MKTLLNVAAMALVLASSAPLAAAQATRAAASTAESVGAADTAATHPWLALPPPPARGSATERAELAYLHSLIAEASPARMEQARWDDAHEDPSVFDAVVGRPLRTLPRTWALLETVQHETDLEINVAKNHFGRTRPYGVDPTLHSCEPGPSKPPTRSYPSGHSGLGFSVGYVLAQMMPERAPQILARAADYAISREYCAAHFPSDTEASHVVGSLMAARLLADPRLADRVAAARAELSAAR